MIKHASPCVFLFIIISLAFASCATLPGVQHIPDNMVVISKGDFIMGMDYEELNERPEHEIFLDTFLIDRYEVSAKDFADFMNEKGNPWNKYFTADNYSTIIEAPTSDKNGDKAEVRYSPRKGFENFPANNISWFGADAYCRWKGKRLPTEAEWEKAAKGTDRRVYPWGNNPPDNVRSRYNQKWEEQGLKVMVAVDALPDGASYYGVLNMSGNCWEWVNDWYRQNYCNYCDPDGIEYMETAAKILGTDWVLVKKQAKDQDAPPKYDPRGPLLGVFKVLRGGSWEESYEKMLMSSYRYWLAPEERRRNTGFRCAQ